ncbi:hypothetical protein B4102_2468 [Heyndrickxia sporothermodurans]|uniref:Uncharacterized protein n=1 Tax=Heyndrickxia sporothermodurans TaxID=46224 RepID=A0A150LBV6_9BACI|nr:hypothetical protein B4102_2468 [Heyndrickxia sporothermodurans]
MKYKIKWQYKGAKTESILLESEWASDDVIETLMNDFLKTGRTVDLSIVDELCKASHNSSYGKLIIM